MNRAFASDQEGQALVIVGLAMVVLVAAIALSADWGFSFLTRRGAQNEADAAALAAGRLLASTYVGGSQPFEATEEQTWCEAQRQRDANASSSPTGITRSLSISFSADGTVWTGITNVDDCLSPATDTPVPDGTTLVRATAGATYTSLFGAITRQTIVVQASARAQLAAGSSTRPLPIPTINAGVAGPGLSGSTISPNSAIWPLVRRYDPSDFSGSPCGQYCDDSSRRIRLWPDASQTFGSFSGLVTMSHYSPREAAGGSNVHQLITESDYTGSPNAHHQGHSPNPPMLNSDNRACGGAATWDTNGVGSLAGATSCDIPNWFRYGFRGSLSLETNWVQTGSWSVFENNPNPVEMPMMLPASRTQCSAPSYFPAPSCIGIPNLAGDWVETVPGDIDDLMRDQMRVFVQSYGREAPNGRGLAVVVHVFLWDCADQFSAGAWTRIADNASQDCNIDLATTPDRVHLFSVVPFTVYLDDIRPNGAVRVDGYWGDVFSDAGRCGGTPLPAGCDLNPLINTAYLIPDE